MIIGPERYPLGVRPALAVSGGTPVSASRPAESFELQGAVEQRMPHAPAAGAPQPLSANLAASPFDKFMKFRDFDLQVVRGQKVETQRVGVLNGPGHNVSAVAAIVLDPGGTPNLVLKSGDTRIARPMHGAPYVKDNFIAGRMDKVGADPTKIGASEIAEEVGGTVVGNSLRPLGGWMSPTMPKESSESDSYFMALIGLDKLPEGDGGGMEVPGLIAPKFVRPDDFIRGVQDGSVGDAGRVDVVFSRALDSIGYLPELGVWVQDHPQLQSRFNTMGLGEAVDPRKQVQGAPLPTLEHTPGPEQFIDGGKFVERTDLPVGPGQVMVDGKSVHTIDGEPFGKTFANQILNLDYDRVKVVSYFVDPKLGPLVKMSDQEQPVLAVKGMALTGETTTDRQENLNFIQRDLDDVKVSREQGAFEQLAGQFSGKLTQLGQPTTASAGQSDLFYYFAGHEVKPTRDPDYVPLSQALQLCREGQGDAQSEATLLRLSRELKWVPSLNMSVAEARALLSPAPPAPVATAPAEAEWNLR